MTAARDSVTVRVPASTSNCGAGFDTLGLALALYNRVTVTRDDSGTATPQPARPADARAEAMVKDTAAAFFHAANCRATGFVYRIEGDVPPARGLGSSVTVIGGILTGLNELFAANLSRHKLVEIATALEGHPDNASAGLLGGFCVSRCDPATNAYVDTVRLNVPSDLAFVVVSPSSEMLTKESRGVLPATLPYFDAVKSINSAVYFTAAFATGDYERLRHAVTDFMHEPYRLPRIRGGREAISAGVAAGALTGWLSGSGSSVLCLTRQGKAEVVLAAMRRAFENVSVVCEGRVLAADNEGVRVE